MLRDRLTVCLDSFDLVCLSVSSQVPHWQEQRHKPPPPPPIPVPTHADLLRGNYGEFRANNDLLSYDLDVRVDPAKKFIGGSNTIRFRMLEDGTRIQIV